MGRGASFLLEIFQACHNSGKWSLPFINSIRHNRPADVFQRRITINQDLTDLGLYSLKYVIQQSLTGYFFKELVTVPHSP